MTKGTYQILLDYAFMALSRRAHSVAELEKKLARRIKMKGIGTQADQRKVIARLKELKYLNDNDFTRNYIQSRTQSNPKGKFLITRELRLKGVPKEIIEKKWGELHINEEELAHNLLKKKKRTLARVKPEKRREKIIYYLSSRGFHPEIVYRLIDKDQIKALCN